MPTTTIELTTIQAVVGVLVAIVGFATTFAGLVKVWTKQEMTTKRLEEIVEQQKKDCADWRTNCLGHRKDEHDTFRGDIREVRGEFKALRELIFDQTSAFKVTNQRLQDLVETLKVAR